MFYLIFNIIFASAFTLIIKWVGIRAREDIVTVGAVNYVVAALLIMPVFAAGDARPISSHAVITGAVMGTCYFVTFFFVVHAVQQIGASSATVIGGLSILLPILCGAFIWSEWPNGCQAAGIGLAIISLALIGPHGRGTLERKRAWVTPIVLVLFFLLAGTARLSQDAFKHGSSPDQRPTFLITAFSFAAIPSLFILCYRNRKCSWLELVFGSAMGVVNILQLHFTLSALQYLPGYIVFPIASAGTLILTLVVATQLLQERLNRKTYLGVAVASIALVLLHWLPAS